MDEIATLHKVDYIYMNVTHTHTHTHTHQYKQFTNAVPRAHTTTGGTTPA